MQRPDGAIENDKVYSKHLQWLPGGSEYPTETSTVFAREQPIEMDAKPITGDIMLAKLRPGQHIELEAHAVRGTGADHAKFSPVGTAWHRLYPEIAVLQVRNSALKCPFHDSVQFRW
jgi:DNA-directed RNA polymerases I and III subunit RPAC1